MQFDCHVCHVINFTIVDLYPCLDYLFLSVYLMYTIFLEICGIQLKNVIGRTDLQGLPKGLNFVRSCRMQTQLMSACACICCLCKSKRMVWVG